MREGELVVPASFVGAAGRLLCCDEERRGGVREVQRIGVTGRHVSLEVTERELCQLDVAVPVLQPARRPRCVTHSLRVEVDVVASKARPIDLTARQKAQALRAAEEAGIHDEASTVAASDLRLIL